MINVLTSTLENEQVFRAVVGPESSGDGYSGGCVGHVNAITESIIAVGIGCPVLAFYVLGCAISLL